MKQAKLPRGLYRHPRSGFIYFSYRDSRYQQHQQSTGETDPDAAMIFKIQFLQKLREQPEEAVKEDKPENMGRKPLRDVAEEYFNWKQADGSAGTVARERRLFKRVLKFFGANLPTKLINLAKIREYQIMRRQEVSPTMKTTVTPRTVNYEMQLLRAVMNYAECWTDHLEAQYKPLRQKKSRKGRAATKEELKRIITTATKNDQWQTALYCFAVAVGTGCRGCELKTLQLRHIQMDAGKIIVRPEVAKNREQREPILMAIAQWGLRNLLQRAASLGATEPEHYLLPFSNQKSKHLTDDAPNKYDVNRPMVTWIRSWRSLMKECGMTGFRFHDLRHTFRTLGAEAGVPLEVMMTQLGHMDRETSLDYTHIQHRALERAKSLIEAEQKDIFSVLEGLPTASDVAMLSA